MAAPRPDKRWTALCRNHLRMPLHRVDLAVLQKLAEGALRPPVVRAIVDGVVEQITPTFYIDELERRRVALHQVEHRFEGELRLGETVAGMAGLPTDLVAVRRSAKGCTLRFAGIAA
jgi:hypothetical protein